MRSDAADDDACPVCLWSDPDAAIQPCGHRLCGACALQALMRCGMKCPLCRGDAYDLFPDEAAAWYPSGGTAIPVGNGVHMGITLANDAKGCGVVVARLVPGDAADRAGLEIGQRILQINHIPVVHHADAITVINAATAHACTLRVFCEAPPPNPGFTVRYKRYLRRTAEAHHRARRAWARSHA